MTHTRCRSCGAKLEHSFCDLGLSPISNAFIKPGQEQFGEMFYPLAALVCDQCWLVQLNDSPKSDAHFHDDYVYFSSFSESWLDHARRYVAETSARFGLNAQSQVIELASNDGYLLQYFVHSGIPCLGIEPTANTAQAARERGVPTREAFFGKTTAEGLRSEGLSTDLLIGNNVLAHVPDINDFVAGMPIVLKPEGVITLEFPHLLRLIGGNQFDTIYHEHYGYLSLTALLPVFARAGLRVFDVSALSTHGGSLRLYICHENSARHLTQAAVKALINEEKDAGLTTLATYTAFADQVRATKLALLDFMVQAKRQGKRIAAYGAAAKGNTLLNYCGIGRDFIDFVVDRNPTKQGRLLPGTRIPVVAPEAIAARQPDYLLILPWNIKDEIIRQNAAIRAWGGQFVIPIPHVEIVS